jgi:S1-C subfamily serine protease
VGRGLRWMLRTVSGLEVAAASSITRGRRYVVRWALAAACAACFAWPAPMHAQSVFSTPSPRQQAENLARTSGLTTVTRQKSGTAFFVDDIGHMLTARHVADSCVRVVVAKEGRAVAASVVALSGQLDIALIKVPKTLGLAAIFPRNVTVAANDMMFVAAYDTLPRMTAGGGTLGNATVASSGSEADYLAIDSNVTFGSSGAPVLDSRGLVHGVISGRINEVKLPTAYSAPMGEMSMSVLKVAPDRVLAVSAARAKAFLAANGIAIVEDDRPQIDPSSSRANRAASISARVTCLQN